MKKDQCQTVKDIMEKLDGVSLREKQGSCFRFNMYMTGSMKETQIDALDLTPRPYNSLKRVGCSTIGQLTGLAAGDDGLKNIRNCGKRSIREIMEKLFLYQYNILTDERRKEYLLEVVALNISKK